MTSKNQPEPDRMIRMREVERLTGLSHATIYMLEREGKFPARTKITVKASRWRLSAVQQWVAERERETVNMPPDRLSATARAARLKAREAADHLVP